MCGQYDVCTTAMHAWTCWDMLHCYLPTGRAVSRMFQRLILELGIVADRGEGYCMAAVGIARGGVGLGFTRGLYTSGARVPLIL